MAAPIVVPSVPWMPERAWTTCVSLGCVSGLARSNYVPFAPQPLPPGMSEAFYESLDPAPVPGFGVPPADDCFPRYVMWREDVRIPDFAGGMPPILWNRNPGWDFRNDCIASVLPCGLDYDDSGPEFLSGGCLSGPNVFDANEADIIGGSGNYGFEWRIWDESGSVGSPQLIDTNPVITLNAAQMGATFPGGTCDVAVPTPGFQLVVTDLDQPGCSMTRTGIWSWCCV